MTIHFTNGEYIESHAVLRPLVTWNPMFPDKYVTESLKITFYCLLVQNCLM